MCVEGGTALRPPPLEMGSLGPGLRAHVGCTRTKIYLGLASQEKPYRRVRGTGGSVGVIGGGRWWLVVISRQQYGTAGSFQSAK